MDALVVRTGSQVPASPEPGLINPRVLVGLARRRLWPMLLTIAIVLTVAVIVYMRTDPQYFAKASVALDRRTEEIVNVSGAAPLSTDSPSVDTAVQILRSPNLATTVVNRLNLQRVPDFGFGEDELPGDVGAARERAISVVQGGLQAARIGTSYAIEVSYSAKDPTLAANIVNTAVDSYVEKLRSAKSAERERDIRLLRERLGQLRADVMAAEDTLAKFRARTNLIDLHEDGAAAQATLQSLNTQLAQARAEQALADARASTAAGDRGDALSDVLNSGVVSHLRTQQATLRAQRADLAGRYGERHPTLANLDRQLAEIDRNLAAQVSTVQTSVDSEARIAANRTASIESSISKVQGRLLDANNASVQVHELQRNAESAKGLYQAVLDRYRQSVAAQGTERSDAYVIAYARTPGEPYAPSLPAYLIGGLLASLVAAAFVALLLETTERGFRTRSSLEEALGIPVLAALPDMATLKDVPLRRGSPLAIADHLVAHPGSLLDEAFRSVRTALRIGQEEQAVRSIAVTSAIAEEGKTTAAICLTRSAALAGLRVVLVDCDLRRRASSRTLVDRLEFGLVEVLKGEAQLEQALVRDGASGAHFLPQRPSAEAEYDLIASREMGTLLKRLGEIYDLVVLDTAPVLPVAESRAVSAMADGVLLLVRWRKTPTQAARMAVDQLVRTGANLSGAMLTKVDVRTTATSGAGEEVYYYPGTRSQRQKRLASAQQPLQPEAT